MPDLIPDPTWIFHITPIVQLTSIARCAGLLSKNEVLRRGINAANIAYANIQGRRALKAVPSGAGGTLHDYVPFYFAPRSPMLMTINNGNVPGCDYRQGDIVHLVSSAQLIAQTSQSFVFTNFHAAMIFADFFDDLVDLNQIDWSIFFEEPKLDGYCQFWNSNLKAQKWARRKESRQAEFLVHNVVPLASIKVIAVIDSKAEKKVEQVLAGTGWNPKVIVRPGWYYLKRKR